MERSTKEVAPGERSLIDRRDDDGRATAEQIARWADVAPLLAALEAIGRDGANAIVKIDGGRPDGSIFTVVVSGGKLGDDFFRIDGEDLRVLLRDAVAHYRARATSAR